MTWKLIHTCEPTEGLRAILAVPSLDGGHHVGEAHFCRGDWWWAGMYPNDAWSDPISETNHFPPSHWQAMPAEPCRQNTEGLS